jgi:D-alanyl-D-alanine carboxypeptidase
MWRVQLAVSLAILISFSAAITGTVQTDLSGGAGGPPLAATSNPVQPPKCAFADRETRLDGYDDWARTLVDPTFSVPASYVPPDLVNTARAGLNGGFRIRRVAEADLKALASAAAAAGAPLEIVSAYRSYHDQAVAHSKWVHTLGLEAASQSSARAGHSEHQLGLAIDFKSRGGPLPWVYYSWARDTAAGRWMAANAWRYGWIMSYPASKTGQTCMGYEPWHYRYVGRTEAALVHYSGLTLRQWLWQDQVRTVGA